MADDVQFGWEVTPAVSNYQGPLCRVVYFYSVVHGAGPGPAAAVEFESDEVKEDAAAFRSR